MPLDSTPPIGPAATDFNCDAQDVIAANQTVVDGCPVLPKLQCHEVQMAQNAKLLWNFKNPQGKTVNLMDCMGGCSPCSVSSDQFDAYNSPGCGPMLRMREISGADPIKDKVIEVNATIIDPLAGFVRSDPLPDSITRSPGVYLEEWAFFDTSGNLVFSNQCYTFVRRGLFGLSSDPYKQNLGPPTLEEIRLAMRDNSPADNMLLDDVEFDAAEIAQAVVRPVLYWNETPPPIQPLMTTKTFPFREMWLVGIQAYLFDMVASHYRRNQLAYQAGGVAVDDKNKEQQYRAISNQLTQQFREMLRAKKIEINIGLFNGVLGSPYSGMFYT
jgi:hypothetical protein